MDIDSKTDSDAAPQKMSSSVGRKKQADFSSKYSGSRKSSIDTTNTGNIKNMPRIENTYKLCPDETKRYLTYKIYPIIYDLLMDKVSSNEKANPTGYNPKACASLTRELADSIRREAKNFNVPRYKIIVHTVVGENSEQDVRVASRCLWNTDFDNSVSVSYKGKYMWANAVIYVLYSE